MHNSKLVRFVTATLCVFMLGTAIAVPCAVSAAEGDAEEKPDTLMANAKYPAMTGSADSTFKFEVQFTFTTQKASGDDFDLTVSGPPNWIAYVAESAYALDSQISSIHLEQFSVLESVVVVVVAPFWLYPESGDYPIEFRATSADVDQVVDLTATITPRYSLMAETTSGTSNVKTDIGEPVVFGIRVVNSGMAALEDVLLTSDSPADVEGNAWDVTFSPENLKNLAPGAEEEIEVSVTPPKGMAAGDYMVTLKFDGDPALSSAPPELDIRVSATKKSAWGIIGAIIVVVAIGGLVYSYRKLGRS